MFVNENMLRIAAKFIAYFFSKNMSHFFSCKTRNVPSVILDTITRVIFPSTYCFPSCLIADLFAPPRFTKRVQREARKEALIRHRPLKWECFQAMRLHSIDLTFDLAESICVPSRYAWRQHHRGCPGRRFGCPVPSVGMRTHQWLTVCPIVSTYRYTHGNLSQELVAIVIN